jgi:integrase
MKIQELASRYIDRVGGSPGYLEQYRVCVGRLDWDVSDLTPDAIDQYLTSAQRHLAPSTVHNHRRMLARLLAFAVSEGLVDRSILRPVKRIKRPPPCPVAWSHAEIRKLLEAAKNLQGGVKCPHRVLMRAWILVAYSTGLRLGDLLSVTHDQVRGRRILVRQGKTQEPHICYLDDLAKAALDALPRRGARIFGDLICRDKLLRQMRILTARAKVNGSTKFLRRSGATYAELAGKNPSGHLGHRTPSMKAYYIDRLLLAEERQDGPTTMPLLEST